MPVTRELARTICGQLPAILTDVRDLLDRRHLDYADFLDEEFDNVLHTARGIVERLVGLLSAGPTREAVTLARFSGSSEQILFERIGRSHFQQKRNLTDLLAAYRASAALAWRHISDSALDLRLPTELIAALADAVLTAVDELSSATLEGYAQAQTGHTLELDHRQRELADLLLSDRADTHVVERAAIRAQWRLPTTAAVALLDQDAEIRPPHAAGTGESWLLTHDDHATLAVIPDPNGPGRRTALTRALRGHRVIVGPTMPVDRLPVSRRLADRAAKLRASTVLDGDPLFVADHLPTVLVHQDEPLLAAVRDQYLHPLSELPVATRDRLITTLAAWLLHMGNQKDVAAQLHIHPQTVRYRLGQLRDLLGPALDSPQARAALMLAVAWGEPTDLPAPPHPDGRR